MYPKTNIRQTATDTVLSNDILYRFMIRQLDVDVLIS